MWVSKPVTSKSDRWLNACPSRPGTPQKANLSSGRILLPVSCSGAHLARPGVMSTRPSKRASAGVILLLFSTHCGQARSDGATPPARGGTAGGGGSDEPRAGVGGAGPPAAGAAGTAGVGTSGGGGANGGGPGSSGAAGAGVGGVSGGLGGASAAEAGEGGGGGVPEDLCPDTRPPNSTTCELGTPSVCLYGSETCRCFTPDFMYQPPLWSCVNTGAGGSS